MSKNLLSKINEISFLSKMFAFIPRKRAMKITLINKSLSSQMNLSIDDYLLEEKYRKIILRSKGIINVIGAKVLKCYKESENINQITFPQLLQKVLKYMKYLLVRKVIRYYTVSFDYFFLQNLLQVSFTLEVIRYLQKNIRFETCGAFNFKCYDILKDAINNMEEIHSVTNYYISKTTTSRANEFRYYYEMFDWRKVKCIDLNRNNKVHLGRGTLLKLISIPDDATFRKIIINDSYFFSCNKLVPFMHIHGEHVEYLKIFNYNDFKVDIMFYLNLTKIKKVKFIKCSHLVFSNFLFFFKNNLPLIKVLVLDNVLESDCKDLSEQKHNFYILQNVLPRLTNLEKLTLNFINTSDDIFKLLTTIVSLNPNLIELKISLDFQPKKIINQKKLTFLEKFIGKDVETKESYLTEFNTFINAISSLKKLSCLELNFELNEKMTEIVSNCLHVGESLRCLKINHTKNLNMTLLLNSHSNLNKINLCLNAKDAEDTKGKFNYEFDIRNWKSISLKNYPLNNSFIDALIKAKNSLNDLTLDNTLNACGKSDSDVNNILLAIKNNMI